MRIPLYSELETRVRTDLDLLDADNFIGGDEMAQLFNEGIQDAESEVLTLNQDYFLTQATLTMVNGVSSYTLPSDIYGQKIRGLIYSNGPKIYPAVKIRELNEFYKYEEVNYYATGETEYGYILRNDTAGLAPTISLTPPAKEDGAFLKLWYIRHAKRIPLITESAITRTIQLNTPMDIPEASDYIIQYVKCRCYEKEMDPRLPQALEALAAKKKTFVETMSRQLVDNSDDIPVDIQFYTEHN